MKRGIGFIGVFFLLLGLDFALKLYVHREIPLITSAMMVYPYGGIALFRDWHGIDCSLVHAINRGAAWGILSSFQDYLLYLRIAIIGGLITYLCFVSSSVYRKWSLLLVTAGACANVIDHFVYGHVVDMFYFVFWGYSYPIFNLADSLICVGIVLLLAESLVHKIGLKKTPSSKAKSRSA